MDPAAFKALEQAAGPGHFVRDPLEAYAYSYDASGYFHPAEAVIRGVDAEQIGRVMAACTAHGVPVVPRGAGSGLTGGAVPQAGGVVLDLAGMNRVIGIQVDDQTAVVQPGVVTSDLQKAVMAQGLFYPPDPASVDFCTIGGNLAENAGGLRAVKYGVTRDYVLGLQAVLPDGRVFRTGGSTLKSVVGFDLTRLLVGSEGVLAVITEATLRLLPLPEAKASLNALFTTLQDAAAAVQNVLASGIRPTALEFMDAACLKAVDQYAHIGLDPSAQAMLLIDVDGPPEVAPRQARDLVKVLEASGGRRIRLAEDPAEADLLWKARRAAGPAIRHVAPAKMDEDIAVPLGKLAEMVRRVQRIAEKRRVTVVNFGHAGDGNLHVTITFDPQKPEQVEAAQAAKNDVFDQAVALGGSISGEHGIGLSKRKYLLKELDPAAADLMKGIKQVFDPAGVLNPHKAIL